MLELLDRMHLYMTGVRIPKVVQAVEFGVPGKDTLSDCRVIVGRDRIRATVPPRYYPFLILENGSERGAPGMSRSGSLAVSILMAVLVQGPNGALIGDDGILVLQQRLKDLFGLGSDDTLDRRKREKLFVDGTPYTGGVSSYAFDPDMDTGDNGLVALQLATLSINYNKL